MLVNELVMARPRSFTASSSTSATARSGCFAAQLRHRPLLVAGNHQMPDLAMPVERLLQQGHALRTLARTGKRNPEILSSRTVILLEFRQQRRTRDGPHVATPTPAQQWSQSPPGVVGCAGTHQIHGWRRGASAADSGTPQHVVQFGGVIAAALVGVAPGVRLLPDFARRVLEPSLGFFLLRQIQQCAQRVAQREISSVQVYYNPTPLKSIRKEKKCSSEVIVSRRFFSKPRRLFRQLIWLSGVFIS